MHGVPGAEVHEDLMSSEGTQQACKTWLEGALRTTWFSGWPPWQRQKGWNEMIIKVSSNTKHFMRVLWLNKPFLCEGLPKLLLKLIVLEMRTLKILCVPLLRLEFDFRYYGPPSVSPCCITEHGNYWCNDALLCNVLFIGKCVYVSLSNNEQNNKLPLIACLHQSVRLH